MASNVNYPLVKLTLFVILPVLLPFGDCKITSLNDKYSQFQTLRSVEVSKGDISTASSLQPSHRLVKRAAGPRLTVNKIIVEKFVLQGTEASNQAFVHWIGKETSEKVIVLTCQFNTSAGIRSVVDSQLWKSDDYGSTFQKTKLGPGSKISYFYTFPSNTQKLLFTDVEAKKIYTSSDELETDLQSHDVPIEPDVVLPNPRDENKILIYSLTHKRLYISEDFGLTWRLLSDKVLPKFYWGFPDFEPEDTVHMEVESHLQGVAEYKSCPSLKCEVGVSELTRTLGPFLADTLYVNKEFMFVQKSSLNGSDGYLMVSHRRGPFQKAYFPGDAKTYDFMLLNVDHGQVFVAVIHENSVSLYLSDTTGHYFVLSLSDVYHVVHPFWLEIDLHQVQGMDWIYLANKRMPKTPGNVQTYISFDKGGNWGPIPLSKELQKTCKNSVADCHLLLNIKQSPILNPVISSKNAPGLIIAHGALISGTGAAHPTSVYTSRDAGLTWTKAPFDGLYNLNILDQGSILTAIPAGLFSRNRTTSLRFSCDQGASWKTSLYDNLGFMVNGVLTEPGILTLTETLFGHEGVAKPWILMKLNYSLVLQDKCTDRDYESWYPEDFNDASENPNNCTMGSLIVYQRRKQMSECYNGEELIPWVKSKDSCPCTDEDYECDFGYQKDGTKCTKSSWYYEGYLPIACKKGEDYFKSRGYRKVSSDNCTETDEDKKKFDKIKSRCAVVKPHGLALSTHSLNAVIGKEVFFYLSQRGGSIHDTKYTWDFGDGSQPQAYADIEKTREVKYTYSKAGHFKVTVKAQNVQGEAMAVLVLHVQEPLNDLTMITPLAAKVGVPVTLSVIVYSQLRPYQDNSDHVHFVWTFGDEGTSSSRPTLTWDHHTTHTYQRKGLYTVSVEAFNAIGSVYKQFEMEIVDEAEILMVRFEGSSIVNVSNPMISRLLLQRLRYQLVDDLGLGLDRVETTYSPTSSSKPSALVYILPSANPTEESVETIKQRVISLVRSGNFDFSLLGKRSEGGLNINVTSVEPYTPSTPDDGGGGGSGGHSGSGVNMKAIFIGVPVLCLVVVTCILLLLCYCRRKHRSAQQYSMLHIQDDSDPLLDDEDEAPLDLNIEFRGGRDSYRDDALLDSGGGTGSHLVMQDTVEHC